jgi:hypothetical protein
VVAVRRRMRAVNPNSVGETVKSAGPGLDGRGRPGRGTGTRWAGERAGVQEGTRGEAAGELRSRPAYSPTRVGQVSHLCGLIRGRAARLSQWKSGR